MPRLEPFAILLWFSFKATQYCKQLLLCYLLPLLPASLCLSFISGLSSFPPLPPSIPPVLPSPLPALPLSTETLLPAPPCYKRKVTVLKAEISP